MSPEPSVDPRDQSLQPTQEEIEAWAAREHARRAAWLAGPSEPEKQEFIRRYRWRAALGLEESRLGPSPDEAERWAEREHRRREAWVAGPTAAERQRWASRRAAGTDAPAESADVDAWAELERQRRRAWVEGPSEDEKRAWAERQSGGVLEDLMRWPSALEADFPESTQRVLRQAELAGKGAIYSLARMPMALWSYLVRAGRAAEEDFYQEPRRRRVPY